VVEQSVVEWLKALQQQAPERDGKHVPPSLAAWWWPNKRLCLRNEDKVPHELALRHVHCVAADDLGDVEPRGSNDRQVDVVGAEFSREESLLLLHRPGRRQTVCTWGGIHSRGHRPRIAGT
jgi:hypothetical protein